MSEIREYHVTVGVDYSEGFSGALPFYNIEASNCFDAIEKTMGAIRELHEAEQFEVRTISARPAPDSPIGAARALRERVEEEKGWRR